jgi:hypothetical protein
MNLLRSDSPDFARTIGSAPVRASRNWHTSGFALVANALALLVFVVADFDGSRRTAVWLSLTVLLTLNGSILWRAQISNRRWVIVSLANRLYVRLFAWHVEKERGANDQDVLELEASEIVSVRIRTLEVFLYGSKPKLIEWLVIETDKAVARDLRKHGGPLIQTEASKSILVVQEEQCLTIEWKWWRPSLRKYLQKIARECPSIMMGSEERSELDLNSIWHGTREKPDAEQRRKLIRAMQLGFGRKCAELLSLYKSMPLQEAGAYLAEIEREDVGTDRSGIGVSCRF